MCRICGRVVRCIFDSMPSRTLSRPSSIITTHARNTQAQNIRGISSQTTSRLAIAGSQRPRNLGLHIPLRSHLHTTTTQQADVEQSIPMPDDATALPPSMMQVPREPLSTSTTMSMEIPSTRPPSEPQPLVLSKSIQSLLPALRAQSPHYITAHIHSFPYLLTEGDTLRLPFHMHGVTPGDVLRFNRATILGSRDYTLKAGFSSPQHNSPVHVRGEAFINKRRTGEPSYIDERLFECRMRVMALDSGPMMIKEKKKRRNRRTRKVTSKHKYTVLKVMEINVKTLEELTSMEGQQIVLE
jgi:large subunit ribosomal protein L21